MEPACPFFFLPVMLLRSLENTWCLPAASGFCILQKSHCGFLALSETWQWLQKWRDALELPREILPAVHRKKKKNNTDQTTKNPFCPLLSSSICQQLGPCSGSSEQSSRVLYIWGVPEAEKNTRPCSCTSTALTPRVLGEELKPQNLSLDGHE